MYNYNYSIRSISLKLLNYSFGNLGSADIIGASTGSGFLSVKNFFAFCSYVLFPCSISCPHHDGIKQYGLCSFAMTQIIEKNNMLTQNAAAKLRVAIKITVKKSAGRNHGAAKNSSCFFVSSKERKRPPKLSTNIKQPIIYGFVFTNTIACDRGSKTPPVSGG